MASFHADGIVIESRRYLRSGPTNLRLSVALDDTGASLTGAFVSQIKDTGGTVILQVEGDYEARRITV